MIPHSIRRAAFLATALVLFATQAFSATAYDRDLVVKDQTRAMKVEKVFKKLIAAYEDEDPQGFLDLVSDDRFRQDYITFTDALYSDFRNFEIHRVEYWIDRVVSDHIKQFLFVKWEKRFETLEDGRQSTQSGYSRFLFDEVNGKYLLIELAGNSLFGGSLQEWREETPPISGQEITVSTTQATKITGTTIQAPGDSTDQSLCNSSNLGQCLALFDCEGAGGYWYNGTCNSTAQVQCDNAHLFLCDSGNCVSAGGYWYNGTCNSSPAQPDLTVVSAHYSGEMGSSADFLITISNIGPVGSGPFQVQIFAPHGAVALEDISNLRANTQTRITMIAPTDFGPLKVVVDSGLNVTESNENNNSKNILF